MTIEDRVLVLALRGRDAAVLEQLLVRDGHNSVICAGEDRLGAALEVGAGAALITEESLGSIGTDLGRWLENQPPWSDFPFILLSTKRVGRRPREAQLVLEQLGNVVVLERPINGETLSSAVTSALRGRRRQYAARQQLRDLTRAEERLIQLNSELETRISLRTSELSAANNRLTQEISERERAQAALVQSQKMEAVGQLTGGIAHDFNNLLTVIFGNLEMIQNRTNEERTAKLVGYAQQAADRAAKLTHQLLAFSRTQRLSLEPVDLNALVQGMNDLLARTIGTRVTIRMEIDDEAPWALADVNQLELAILNLAINARDAMPESGTLTISTRRASDPDSGLSPGEYGVVSVIDTGTGIPDGLIDRVFDPFFTTKAVGKGTGLGLSQVYGMAQQSGGSVAISSTEGQGTRIEIFLPVAPANDILQSVMDPGPTVDQSQGGKVHVIDDDDGVRRFIVESLRESGYEVSESINGADGLRAVAASQPDLLIVDYAMPGMTGVQVVEAMSRMAPDMPIILATGYADMAAVDAVLSRSRVLRKPFRIHDLTAAVQSALAQPVEAGRTV